MKIRISTLAKWLLVGAIFLSENFLYVINKDSYILGFSVQDLGLVLVFLIGTLYLIVTRESVVDGKYNFAGFIIFGFVLVLMSSIQSNNLYGQPLLLGIRPQRYVMLWLFCYFPLRKAMLLDHISYKKIENIIYKFGIIELILYIAQFLLGDRLEIIHAGTNNVYSTTRYYVNTIFLCMLLFLALDKVFKKERVLFNIILIVGVLFELIMVGKMRMTSIAVIATIMIGVILWKKGGSLKVFLIVAGIAGLAMVSQTEVVQSIISTLNGTAISGINTLGIREIGRVFYLETLNQHPLLGGGYINTQFPAAYAASAVSKGIYWVDNGIFGFAFFFGGLGLFWVLWFIVTFYRRAYVILKNGTYFFFLLPIYWIISSMNEAHWYFCNLFVVVILICMLEKFMDEKIMRR